MTFPSQALFVPHRANDFEISHFGVVLRVRDGKPQHIGGVSVSHVERTPPKYDEVETELERQGHIEVDYKREGYWLVPAKAMDAFAVAWAAEQEQLNAAAQKDG